MSGYIYDSDHVRYELASSNSEKPYNWLFLPGGPGGDSRYLKSLTALLELPGNVWLIDLPGNGDNIENLSDDFSYESWMDIFVPMVKRFENPILVGHSFGGMFPLLFPELEEHLKGFIILNSAPCLWMEAAAKYSQQFLLPDFTKEMAEFTQNPNDATFKKALDACMPYYFPSWTLEKGRALMADVPFRYQASSWWIPTAVQNNFSASWIPENVPTLIIGAKYDCIVPFYLFSQDERFQRNNIELIYLDDAGHFPWVENSAAVKAAFQKFCQKVD